MEILCDFERLKINFNSFFKRSCLILNNNLQISIEIAQSYIKRGMGLEKVV